jgi:rSAM/selenodomain-associated transferase 1
LNGHEGHGDLSARRRSDFALAFMAKWPEPGRAKTRLSPMLTPEDAAALATCFLLDTLDVARFSQADRWVAFAPASTADRFHQLAGPEVGLLSAESQSFGHALAQTQRNLLDIGYRQVALVASDMPHLESRRYAEAFDALESADVALGPCGDGGYYLLAARGATPHLFHAVAWSTASVLSTTVRRAGEAGLSVATISSCDDVDTPSDLQPLFETLSRRPGAGRTLAALDRLGFARAGEPAIPR